MNRVVAICPACADRGTSQLLHWEDVPTNTALFFRSAEEARRSPRGSYRLMLCRRCGFLFNLDHEVGLTGYSDGSLDTQAFSEHYAGFVRDLARGWIDRYALEGRFVFEIGPGHGADFLRMFVGMSGGDAIGIGPSASLEPVSPRVSLIADLFDDRWTALPGDAVICRHTLEHIADVKGFLASLGRWGDRHPDAVYLFEVPNAQRVLDEVAFWDLNYDHCSNFTAPTLAATFADAGFSIERSDLVYDGHYIVLEARRAPAPARAKAEDEAARERHGEAMTQAAERFTARLEETISRGRAHLERLAEDGPVVLWQASVKAVGILDVLGLGHLVEAVVDINPGKRGLHLAGSGHPIVGPAQLPDLAPAHVVCMNPVYIPEIQAAIDSHGVTARLWTANDLTSETTGLSRPRRIKRAAAAPRFVAGDAQATPSPREMEVLALIADGRSNAQIAEQLSITPETVKTHVDHLMRKLRAHNRAHAVGIAARNGLLDPRYATADDERR
jgi:DNA-binding CsgD family transcriptional regulator